MNEPAPRKGLQLAPREWLTARQDKHQLMPTPPPLGMQVAKGTISSEQDLTQVSQGEEKGAEEKIDSL